ncbi:MAG: deoxyribose-phosphate aldolase [Patescibacteria group bacterium]
MKNVLKTIDHTNIDPEATEADIIKTCDEAKEYGFRGVDVLPEWVSLVAEELEDTDMKVIVLIDEPMGLSSHKERMDACKRAVQDGADELDVVMNIIDLKYEKYDSVLEDLSEICALADTKVIIGSGFLTDEEIKKASELVQEAGAICVKTATNKDPIERRQLEEKAKHVKMMSESAPDLFVKASGKIRTLEDAQLMIENGADIIGTSSGVEIAKEVEEAEEAEKEEK